MSGDRLFTTIRLQGRQLVDVTPHHPKTDEARIGIKIGPSLLYVRNAEVLDHIARQWVGLQSQAHQLPRTGNPRLTENYRGIGKSAVMVEFEDPPLCNARKVASGGHDPFFRIQLGDFAYELRDQTSYFTTMSGFVRARDMADRVFIDRYPTIGSEIGLDFDVPFVAGGG